MFQILKPISNISSSPTAWPDPDISPPIGQYNRAPLLRGPLLRDIAYIIGETEAEYPEETESTKTPHTSP